MWNTGLTETEMVTGYNTNVWPSPAVYWPMNEGTGNVLHDATGNGYDWTFDEHLRWLDRSISNDDFDDGHMITTGDDAVLFTPPTSTIKLSGEDWRSGRREQVAQLHASFDCSLTLILLVWLLIIQQHLFLVSTIYGTRSSSVVLFSSGIILVTMLL